MFHQPTRTGAARPGQLVAALVLPTTLALAASVPVRAQQTVEERDEIRAKGIRRVTETRHAYRNGEPDPHGSAWGYVEYDRRGNLVVTGRFVAPGVDSPMYVRVYDGDGRPVERTFYCERTADKPEGKPCLVFRNYRLDEHGNVAEENGYDLDGRFAARVTFRRDASGRPLEREDFFGDGSPENKAYRYEYNDRGDAVLTRTHDTDGKLLHTRRTTYEYDAEGKIVAWHATDGDGEPVGGGRHRYDERGNRVETFQLDAEGQPVRVRRFAYDLRD